MAQRNQFRRPLGGLNAGDLRDGQHVAFRQRVFFQRANRRRSANQFPFRDRAPALNRLVRRRSPCAPRLLRSNVKMFSFSFCGGRRESAHFKFSKIRADSRPLLQLFDCRWQKIHFLARFKRTAIRRHANQRVGFRQTSHVAGTGPRQRMQTRRIISAPARAFRADMARRPVFQPSLSTQKFRRFCRRPVSPAPPRQTNENRRNATADFPEAERHADFIWWGELLTSRLAGTLAPPFTPKISGRPGRTLTWLKRQFQNRAIPAAGG